MRRALLNRWRDEVVIRFPATFQYMSPVIDPSRQTRSMMRRKFIVTLGGTVSLAWPLAADAPRRPTAVSCGSIGAQVRPMRAAFADSLGLTETHGAIFDRSKPASPAVNAGIEAGDVVTRINGSPVVNWRDFTTTIQQWRPGMTVYLTTWRTR
jgi:S1-C subfamily serine protease